LPGGHSEWEPPDPFSNSEVKTLCADASVDFVDVKVGHCQALNLMKTKPSPTQVGEGFFVSGLLSEIGRMVDIGDELRLFRFPAELRTGACARCRGDLMAFFGPLMT
jgi:hypothetical protein